MPVRVNIPGLGTPLLRPTEAWQRVEGVAPGTRGDDVSVDENFYVTARNISGP
jgi:hypothetical protein